IALVMIPLLSRHWPWLAMPLPGRLPSAATALTGRCHGAYRALPDCRPDVGRPVRGVTCRVRAGYALGDLCGRALVSTGPWIHRAAAIRAHSHLRASDADREQVLEFLRAASVQGRLPIDELDARAGLALVSRPYGELAALTADIPSGPVRALPGPPDDPAADPAANPVAEPARTPAS